MRVLIVDDERPARDKLRRLLSQEADIAAIGEARDGVEALEQAAAFAPDVVLLDIQMPEVGGFDVAASLPPPAPLIVFVTAFDEYAIRAFDANAIDYLLKPYDQARLQRALRRVRERMQSRAGADTQGSRPGAILPPPAQLLVTERGVTRVVRVDDIEWLETADNYVALHTAGGQPLLRQTLAGLLDKLGPSFQRCHRRAAVRLASVASVEVDDKGDGELLLHGGARVPLSRQYRPALMLALGRTP
ncbi:LytR/AlgR family response regulator transcription factor [Pseudoduganella namucuonensis]|uniref:Two component transcriptional regulator, LytTR family n=1 Tax=Pseudoduganella namucuonensis TaxID=1035707 RepID=A0A1I7JG11_9BURK|nr:response regulator [Pseudoduganella namucuonensis]SFU84090.1 two component transcriptional regulator, LytTR family [Pseudoduganella namucuonensis]